MFHNFIDVMHSIFQFSCEVLCECSEVCLHHCSMSWLVCAKNFFGYLCELYFLSRCYIFLASKLCWTGDIHRNISAQVFSPSLQGVRDWLNGSIARAQNKADQCSCINIRYEILGSHALYIDRPVKIITWLNSVISSLMLNQWIDNRLFSVTFLLG